MIAEWTDEERTVYAREWAGDEDSEVTTKTGSRGIPMREMAIIGTIALAGCTMPTAIPPMVAASPDDIAVESAKFAAVPVSAQAYLTTGWSINTARCSAYFNALTVRADKNAQTERGLTLLGSAGAAGVALAGGPVGAAAAVPIATALASGFAVNQQDLGGAPPIPTFGLVQSARNVFQVNSSIPPSLDAAAAKAYADRLIQEDAIYCQPAGAQLLSSQAIMTAQPVVMSLTVPAVPTSPQPQPPSMRRSPRPSRGVAPRIRAPEENPTPRNFFEEHPPSFSFDRNGNPLAVPPRIGVVR